MIDEMFQESTDRALDARTLQPPPAAAPQVGTFAGAWRGLGGLPAGGLEAAAGALESAGGYGQVMAATGTMSGRGMGAPASVEERQQNDQAHAKLMREGVDMTDADADKLRTKAKDFMPDPKTVGAAGQVIGGLTRFAGKAVGYVSTMGPTGALPLAFDEALTESDRLKQQGVDFNTRTAAGGVTGLTAGASMFLPFTGATRAIRFAKGAAGGEAAMIGQQEAEKLILEHQHYDKIADTFDPFDPVALAVGAVPGVLGAALGHARAPAPRVHEVVEGLETGGIANPDTAVSRTGAEGRMQVEPATQLDPGFGVRPATVGPDGKVSAAEKARVGHDYLDAMLQRYGSEDRALAAYNAGPGALDAAIAEHGPNWLEHMPAETQAYVQKGMARLGVVNAAADPEVVAAARTLQTADALDASRLTADGDLAGMEAHRQAVEDAFDQMARGDEVNVLDTLERTADALPVESAARVTGLASAIDDLSAARTPPEPPMKPNHAAHAEALAAQEDGTAPKPTATPPSANEGPAGGVEPAHLDAATAHIEATNPDMLVHLDGMEAPMRVGDLMASLRDEVARTGRDSKLIEVAAQCALRS